MTKARRRAYLPLLDHGAELVGGEVHAVEVGEHVASLHLLRVELELAERDLVALKVGQRDLKHAPLQAVRCNLCTTTK